MNVQPKGAGCGTVKAAARRFPIGITARIGLSGPMKGSANGFTEKAPRIAQTGLNSRLFKYFLDSDSRSSVALS